MKSLVLDFHRWRGVGRFCDLFLSGLVCGWVTVGVSRVEMRSRMQKYNELLGRLADTTRGKK